MKWMFLLLGLLCGIFITILFVYLGALRKSFENNNLELWKKEQELRKESWNEYWESYREEAGKCNKIVKVKTQSIPSLRVDFGMVVLNVDNLELLMIDDCWWNHKDKYWVDLESPK